MVVININACCISAMALLRLWQRSIGSFLLLLCFTNVSGVGLLEQAQCRLGELPAADENVVPKNGFKVDHLQLLVEHVSTTAMAQECILRCCQIGPKNCQYVWIVWKQCYAVACSSTSDACRPVRVTETDFDSIYVGVVLSGPKLVFVDHKDNEGLVKEGVSPDHPPVANAGPDVVLHYPEETSVTLDGTMSTDDKGITYYLWQLTSEDHDDQATLINPSRSVLKVLHLTPGLYTFTLTVADSSLHMSTDSVQVRVLADDAISDTPAPPSYTKAFPEAVPSSTEAPPSSTEAPPSSTEAPPSHSKTPSTYNTAPSSAVAIPPTNTTVEAELGSGNSSAVAVEEGMEDLYRKQSNLLKIVIPALFCVALVLVVSAIIVAVSFCFCERNRRTMKHLYQYKRLPGTIEKT